jgi:hypothetical protein
MDDDVVGRMVGAVPAEVDPLATDLERAVLFSRRSLPRLGLSACMVTYRGQGAKS